MLRVKDLDLDRGELTVRRGKGGKDRITVIPQRGQALLQEHLARVKALHDRDLASGGGWWKSPGAWRPSIPGRGRPGRGNGYFRLGGCTGIWRVASSGGTTFTSR